MIDLKKLSKEDLILSTAKTIQKEKQATHEVLEHFREIERRRLYRENGYQSLFEMATKYFGYSAAGAQRRIASMRLIRDMPEAASKIKSGELSLTAAANIHSYFQKSKVDMIQKREVLVACMNKSIQEVEKELASRNPEQDKREDIRFTNAERLRLSLNLSDELYQKLEKLKYLHQLKSIESVISMLADQALTKEISFSNQALQARYIPMATQRIVIKQNSQGLDQSNSEKRDQTNQCEYVDPITQKRCGVTHKLQFDHIHPHSKGGPNLVENLRLLCGEHNRHVWWSVQSHM